MFAKVNITSKVLKEFRTVNSGKDGRIVLQAVQYYKDGDPIGNPKLVNQEFWFDREAQELKPGKNKGLSKEDVRFIAENVTEIFTILES